MTARGLVAIAAMIVMLSLGWLLLSPAAQGEPPTPLRVVASVVLLFGIAFLGAAVAIMLGRRAP